MSLEMMPRSIKDGSLSFGLMEAFADLFKELDQLPPRRDIEHQIHLKDEAGLVNVHLNRYGHFQKEEIEHQVQEML